MEISQDRSIELTNTATDKIMSVLKEGNCTKFRVYVTGGGVLVFNMALNLMMMKHLMMILLIMENLRS